MLDPVMGVIGVNVFAISLPAEHGRRHTLHICNEGHRLGFMYSLIKESFCKSWLSGNITGQNIEVHSEAILSSLVTGNASVLPSVAGICGMDDERVNTVFVNHNFV